MKSWLVIFIGLPSTWQYIDITSDSRIYSLLLPIIFFVFLVTATIKIAIKLGPDGGHSSYGADIGPGGFGGGGDSGGGGDC
ncbi:MAG: hypothetical protein V7765_07395 [Oleispira sp.]